MRRSAALQFSASGGRLRGASGKTFVLGGADRYEAEANRNERRIASWLTGGRVPSLQASGAPSAVRRSPASGPLAAPPSGAPPSTRPIRIRIAKLKLSVHGASSIVAQRSPLGGANRVVERLGALAAPTT